MKKEAGFSLIELIVVLAIFSLVMMALYTAYVTQLRQGVKEFHLAESEMELQIAQTMIERDIAMAGYGIVKADPTVSSFFNNVDPLSAVAGTGTPPAPDTLTLTGIALGRASRATPEWSYTTTASQSTASGFYSPSYLDPRELLKTNDLIIYYEPNTQQILNVSPNANSVTNLSWLFPYPGSGGNPYPSPLGPGVLIYGFSNKSNALTVPYYSVVYSLGGQAPGFCAPGTLNLLRTENNNSQPILDCALDFQVAFGLDRNEVGTIDCWDNGGVLAATYDAQTLRARLRQVKFYALVQEGPLDTTYTYSNPDPFYAATPNKIRVGDTLLTGCGGGGVGEDVTLAATQLNYRWRVLSITETPRNIR